MTAAPPTLELLLHDDRVLKVGVGVHHDLQRLESWLRGLGASATPLAPRGAVEIAPLALSVCGFDGRGLAQIAAELLGVRVHKHPSVRCSDWEAPALTPAQCEYAAEDANLPLEMLREMHRRSGAVDGIHAWAAGAAELQASARAAGAARRTAHGGGGGSRVGSGASVHREKVGFAHGVIGVGGVGGGKGTERRRAFGHVARSAPLYDGWLMLSPEGETMARLKENRARWYVYTDLYMYIYIFIRLADALPRGRDDGSAQGEPGALVYIYRYLSLSLSIYIHI